MSTITIELDEERLKALKKLASEAGVRLEDYVRDALDTYVDLADQGPMPAPPTDEEKAEIEAAIADVRAGRVKPHADVIAAARARIAR